MKKKIAGIFLVLCFIICHVSVAGVHTDQDMCVNVNFEEAKQGKVDIFSDDYGIQWEMNYGPDPSYGARYEDPQPIGDCDNDGKDEINAGSVWVDHGQDFMSWVFKYGWENE